MVEQPGQALTGYTVELFRDIAARLHRDIVFVPVAQAALEAGLAGRRFDLLPGPTDATPEAAAAMLLGEGYAWSEYQFGARRGEPVRRLSDLHGRRLAVPAGTPYAGWAERNAAKHGFSIVVQPDVGDTLATLARHQADATLTGSPAIRSLAARDAGLDAGLSLPETRSQQTAAFRKSDTELREEVEDALSCLKRDGTVARLAHDWMGNDPGDEDIEKLPAPGYGVPGLTGFDPKAKKSHC